jgi:hypothetical protein
MPQGREQYWQVITGDAASAGINGGLKGLARLPDSALWGTPREMGVSCRGQTGD